MSNQLAIITDKINLKSQITAALNQSYNPDLSKVEKLRFEIKAAELEEERDSKIITLLGGDVLTATQLATLVSEKVKTRITSANMNSILIDMGFMKRLDKGNYELTDVALECELGVNWGAGTLKACRWDRCLVDIVSEYLTKVCDD